MAQISAIVGLGVDLTADFTGANELPVDPDTHPVLTIYNPDRKVVHTQQLLDGDKVGTGAYIVRYVPPKRVLPAHLLEVDLAVEFVAPVSSVSQVGTRHILTVSWT